MDRKKVFGIPAQIVFLVLVLILIIPSAVFIFLSYSQLEKNNQFDSDE